jgi:outer membrane protein insertion porin family
MLKKIITLFAIFFFSQLNANADYFSELSVNGNKRISKESIIVFGKIDLSKDLNQNDLNTILKNLYDTNFFEKISISSKNEILFIELVENLIIETIEVNGIENEKLEKIILESMSLTSRKSFRESFFKNDLITIENILRSSGYYFSEIDSTYKVNEKLGTARLFYDIKLGEIAKIDQIKFLGNKQVKTKKLMNIIVSEEKRFWKFLSKNIYLNPQTINLDKKLLKNFYKDNGFYNIKINNSFVEIKNDNSFKLIYSINEGPKFNFNKLTLNLPDDFDPIHFNKINSLLAKLQGKSYSLNKVNKILDEIDKVALSKQYEFIDADFTESIVDENKIDVSISMKETDKFYVEKINISGNSITLEEVIRNSLIVDEGDPLNKILFNKSINNLKSKNIFAVVENQIIDGSNENLKIVNIQVEEKPTGEISLGAGIGSMGGTLGGGIKENNFLGKGVSLNTRLSLTANSVKGNFSVVRPNFNYSDKTLFTSIRSDSIDNLKDFGYKTSNIGASIGTRYEQYENLFFKPTVDIAIEKLTTQDKASKNLKKQAGNYQDIYFTYTFDYDQRDRSYNTTDGYVTSFTQELPVISNNYELTNSFTTSFYQKLFSNNIGKISLYGKSVNTLKDKDTRISKRVFMPSSKLRGFESGKIGPKDSGDHIGGNYVGAINFSSTLPQILPQWDAADFSFFVDAGTVWGVDYDKTIDDSADIRSSTGITLDLASPVGPMNFTLAHPISKNSSDKTETFRFNIGTSF